MVGLSARIDSSRAPQLLTLTNALLSDAELRQLREAGTLTAKTRALIDVRVATRMPSLNEIQARRGTELSEHHWPLRRAYVVRGAAQYGVVRQMQAYAPWQMQIGVFTDETIALEWLCGENEAAA